MPIKYEVKFPILVILNIILNEENEGEYKSEFYVKLDVKNENLGKNNLNENSSNHQKISLSATKKDLIFKIEKKLQDNKIIKEKPDPEFRSIRLSSSELSISEKVSKEYNPIIANPMPLYGYPNIPGEKPLQTPTSFIPKFISERFNYLDYDYNKFVDPMRNNSNSSLNFFNRMEADLQQNNIEKVSNTNVKKESKGFKNIFNSTIPQIELEPINLQSDFFHEENLYICEYNLLFNSSPLQNEALSFIPRKSPISYEEFISLNEELRSANMNSKLYFSSKQ